MRKDFSPFNDDNFPDALKKELNLIRSTDSMILNIFNLGGGTLNTREIMVGLYKCYNLIKTKQFVSSALYRLKSNGSIVSTGRKGEYRIKGDTA